MRTRTIIAHPIKSLRFLRTVAERRSEAATELAAAAAERSALLAEAVAS